MGIHLIWIGVGLAALGYFIGKGLRNFGVPEKECPSHPTLIKEKDLYLFIGLNKGETEDLLKRTPGPPKVILQGTAYYPYEPFLEWLSKSDIYSD